MRHQTQWIGVDLIYGDPEDPRYIERVDSDRLELPIIGGQPPVTIRLPIEIDGDPFFEVFERDSPDNWPESAAYRFRKRIPRPGTQTS